MNRLSHINPSATPQKAADATWGAMMALPMESYV